MIAIVGDDCCKYAYHELFARIERIDAEFHYFPNLSIADLLNERDEQSIVRIAKKRFELEDNLNNQLIIACDKQLPKGVRYLRIGSVLFLSLTQIGTRVSRIDRALLLIGFISLIETTSSPTLNENFTLEIFIAYIRALGLANENRYRHQLVSAYEDNILPASGSHLDIEEDEITFTDEKIIYRDDKLPIAFLMGATRASQSVVRLLVPRFGAGYQEKFPMSNKPKKYLGTGWLIGPRHIITNHHVINARDSQEGDAEKSDFLLQGLNCEVQFDFNSHTADPDSREVEKVLAYDKVLDFTLLLLKQEVGRAPLSLWRQPLVIPEGHNLSVNIIQHPGGAPKQIALRNNLIAKLTDHNLSYFTDTEGGSSGSPVCTDDWYVVALHKASTLAQGNFEFQGKPSAWVNIGTRIDVLIEHLKLHHFEVWSEIEEHGSAH